MKINKILMIFMILLLIFQRVYSEKYVKINPGSCSIISYVEGDYRNVELIYTKYLVRVSSRDLVYSYKIYSLEDPIYVPFDKVMQIEVKSLSNNQLICSKTYNDLQFVQDRVDLSREISKYNYYKEVVKRSREGTMSQWFLLGLPVFAVTIVSSIYLIIKKRRMN
ncbi:MAG: hypothetical protein QXS41_02280 [Candidatus Woesearchaeota archaeon]